ncbi:MAG: 2-C-methyl-D-erythritol 4-phosphate cytidylyltransferase [Alphaproteobacteria bacterium]|jgi:2-C-methyl-D-erythritol 4-phosphate cytidylyltransferase
MAANKAKQYLSIQQKTILEHTVEVFLSHRDIGKIVVVLHPQDQIFATLSIANHPQVVAIVGGSERVDSVLAGLNFISNKHLATQFVLVHDAARPCINPSDITKLISQCTAISPSDEACGAILACPVTDTIKKASTEKVTLANTQSTYVIDKTIDRSLLWQAQTPQMFMVNELIAAIELGLANGKKITDEASAMENMGNYVMLVEGPSSNIKITKPSDVALATFYLSEINKHNKSG